MFVRALALELSRSIQKGNYKNRSLRDVLLQKQLSGGYRRERNRERREQVSLLYSTYEEEEGGGQEEVSNCQIGEDMDESEAMLDDEEE